MAKKSGKESSAAFLKRVTGAKTEADAQKLVEEELIRSVQQRRAIEALGTITIVVIPGGALAHYFSPHLLMHRNSLDAVDTALSEVREYVNSVRNSVIEAEIEQKTKEILKQQEESNGSNSTDSSEHRKDRT